MTKQVTYSLTRDIKVHGMNSRLIYISFAPIKSMCSSLLQKTPVGPSLIHTNTRSEHKEKRDFTTTHNKQGTDTCFQAFNNTWTPWMIDQAVENNTTLKKQKHIYNEFMILVNILSNL